MKKIVLLGLLFLLAGTNTPSTIQANPTQKQDGVLKNGTKTVGSTLRYVFLTTPWNACKAGGNSILDIGKASGKALKHTKLLAYLTTLINLASLEIGKLFKYLSFAIKQHNPLACIVIALILSYPIHLIKK